MNVSLESRYFKEVDLPLLLNPASTIKLAIYKTKLKLELSSELFG